jgi:CRP-like cAMP-binding protein
VGSATNESSQVLFDAIKAATIRAIKAATIRAIKAATISEWLACHPHLVPFAVDLASTYM